MPQGRIVGKGRCFPYIKEEGIEEGFVRTGLGGEEGEGCHGDVM